MHERPINDFSYEQFLDEDKLMGSRCRRCGAVYVPPRPYCVACSGSEMEWFESDGRGWLSAFTCIAVGPPWMKAEGHDREHPYCCGVVKLGEGAQVVARIEGVAAQDPESIRIGMPLKVKFLHRRDDDDVRTFLAFEPI